MNTAVIKFRDKKDIRPLPPIPADLVCEMRVLIDTKINARDLTMFDKLAAVYAFMDRYNAFVATFAVCQKGCSHCCKIDVSVSRLEAEFITHNGGPMLDQGSSYSTNHTMACPFLAKDGACSVYESRPFNCRTFHTLDDPKYCEDGKVDHQVYGASSKGYGVTIYAKIAEWLRSVHNQNGLPYRDIRDWFPTSAQGSSLLDRLVRRVR
ncbi:YkgJ family cysteine cluster protein [Massilia sp. GER05]|uniref:YkgJ family cysteine cluster protein n=1 Tax=Massilia sp. GER05 TaxID=3394605 RepID=UPI003F84A30B